MKNRIELIRGLSLIDAIAIVVGSCIGTGIFLKTTAMSQSLGSPGAVLLVWVGAGLLSFCGALTYAQLARVMPRSGGEYAFLKEAFGNVYAFLFGWMRFWIASPGSIAAYSVGASTFVFGGSKLAAVILIIVFSIINCFKVAFGGGVQAVLTAMKAALILILAFGALFMTDAGHEALTGSATVTVTQAGIGMAFLSALWAYDGWNNLPLVGDEVQNPKRNIPLALIFGMVLVTGLYVVINFAYFVALPFEEVLNANSTDYPDALPVATKAAQLFLDQSAITYLSVAMAISAIGGMHGSILTGARVPYAMAVDGLFPKRFADLEGTTHVPVVAIAVQGLVATALALSGTFDQLTDYVVFASWGFYMLTGAAIFKFRKKIKKDEWLVGWTYPWLPILFVGCSALLLIQTLLNQSESSIKGLVLILLGLPVYFFMSASSKRKRA